MLVGLPTIEAVWGNKVASSAMDDYLAATGFASQRPERVSPDRKDNLFEPVAGDHGAHGSFDDEAVDSGAELSISEHKTQLGLAALGAAAIAGAGFMLAGQGGPVRRAAPLQSQSAELSLACTHPARAFASSAARGRRNRHRRRGGARVATAAGVAPIGGPQPARCRSARRRSGDPVPQRRTRQRHRHYRGQFKDRAMFVGPTMAALGLAAATYIAFRPERARDRAPRIALMIVGATGLIGLGFHTYNILKRPGELDALNLFYGAPMGAPAALTLAGLYGVIAGEMLSGRRYVRTRLPRHTAGLIAFSLIGTVGEAGLLHFRGAFQNPVMFAPVTRAAARGGRAWRGGAHAARAAGHRAAGSATGAARASPAPASTPTAFAATWAAGATGARSPERTAAAGAAEPFSALALAGLAALRLYGRAA